MQINRISANTFKPNFGAKLTFSPRIRYISTEKKQWLEDNFSKATEDVEGELYVSNYYDGDKIFTFRNNGLEQSVYASDTVFDNIGINIEETLQKLVQTVKGLSMINAIEHEAIEFGQRRKETTANAEMMVKDALYRTFAWTDVHKS